MVFPATAGSVGLDIRLREDYLYAACTELECGGVQVEFERSFSTVLCRRCLKRWSVTQDGVAGRTPYCRVSEPSSPATSESQRRRVKRWLVQWTGVPEGSIDVELEFP